MLTTLDRGMICRQVEMHAMERVVGARALDLMKG